MIKICIKPVIAVALFTLLSGLLYHFSSVEAKISELNLLSPQTVWQPFAAAIVNQNETDLDIIVVTNFTSELWNRAYLPISISNSTNKPMIFSLQYATASYLGNATFFAEIRDNKSGEIIWTDSLNNTRGQYSTQFFVLPVSILNSQVEFRLYILSDGPGEHAMNVKKAIIAFSNVTQPIKVEAS